MPYEFTPLLVAPPIFSTKLARPKGTSRMNGGSYKKKPELYFKIKKNLQDKNIFVKKYEVLNYISKE